LFLIAYDHIPRARKRTARFELGWVGFTSYPACAYSIVPRRHDAAVCSGINSRQRFVCAYGSCSGVDPY
jgi:hypothetical protein